MTVEEDVFGSSFLRSLERSYRRETTGNEIKGRREKRQPGPLLKESRPR